MVVIGHNGVGERVARQIHIVLVWRFVVVLHSLSILGKHHRRLIVFNDAVILDEAVDVSVGHFGIHVIELCCTLVFLDTRKLTSKNRPITSARPCFTLYLWRHHLFLSEDLLRGLGSRQRVFLARSLT